MYKRYQEVRSTGRYEGLNLARQIRQKLVVFDQKLEGSNSIFH